jgi:hypothetical protein
MSLNGARADEEPRADLGFVRPFLASRADACRAAYRRSAVFPTPAAFPDGQGRDPGVPWCEGWRSQLTVAACVVHCCGRGLAVGCGVPFCERSRAWRS